MEISVHFKSRELKYFLKGSQKEGLESLIADIGKEKEKIRKLNFIGETDSYTFIRQIYLLINVLASISDFEISLNGELVNEFEQIFPVYR